MYASTLATVYRAIVNMFNITNVPVLVRTCIFVYFGKCFSDEQSCLWIRCSMFSLQVMYVTATSPYIFMLILLIRMAFLDGARNGVLYYLVPDFTKMTESEVKIHPNFKLISCKNNQTLCFPQQVWIDAGTQIFFSYSISLGALTALGSYNKWNHNSYR